MSSEEKKITVYEKIKSMSIDEMTDFISKYGDYDNGPWTAWFGNTYCKQCPDIDVLSQSEHRPLKYFYCDLNGRCRFIPGKDYMDDRSIIRLWLQKIFEAKNDG